MNAGDCQRCLELEHELRERELQQRGERPLRGMFDKPANDLNQMELF